MRYMTCISPRSPNVARRGSAGRIDDFANRDEVLRQERKKKTGRSVMRWLTLIAAGFVVGCSTMQPAPSPSRPIAQQPPAMMNKAEAVKVLTEDGYISPTLVPSQTY